MYVVVLVVFLCSSSCVRVQFSLCSSSILVVFEFNFVVFKFNPTHPLTHPPPPTHSNQLTFRYETKAKEDAHVSRKQQRLRSSSKAQKKQEDAGEKDMRQIAHVPHPKAARDAVGHFTSHMRKIVRDGLKDGDSRSRVNLRDCQDAME